MVNLKKTFDYNYEERAELLHAVSALINEYYDNVEDLSVASKYDRKEVQSYIKYLISKEGADRKALLQDLMHGLQTFAVQTPHPSYYGLYNPRTMFASVLSEMLTATTNPQLAAWSHNPFSNEVERYLIDEICKRIGYTVAESDGVFCNGGAEANLTAILCALQYAYPNYAEDGLFGIKNKPRIYVSAESHHSILKAAKITGLGFESVQQIQTMPTLEMDVKQLEEFILTDISNGFKPLMLVATAGTTGTGTIDPIEQLIQISKKYDVWCHVDGAYGGAVIFHDAYKHLLAGIAEADSVTLDIHKWLSVQMASSTFTTKHPKILEATFKTSTSYMPSKEGDAIDPYTNSIQWSRRTIGMKFFVSVLLYGWPAFSDLIEQQIVRGELLRSLLMESGFEVLNNTILPVVCVLPSSDFELQQEHIDKLISTGKVWLSTYPINGKNTIRMCLTNYATTERHIIDVVYLLKTHL